MRLSDARIGYGAYSPDFSVPGDRRRFAAYARQRRLDIAFADINGDYDLAYLTHNSDLPLWIERKRREGEGLRIVFELIDSYLTETGLFRRFSKGVARYLTGMESRLSPDFLRTLTSMISLADAVICSTEEQKRDLLPHNRNVFVSFDHFQDDIDTVKTDYGRQERLRLVWEGQAVGLHNLRLIAPVLNALRDRIELHVVTDPVRYRYLKRYGATPSLRILEGIHCPIVFRTWDKESFSRNVAECDVAVIPIDLDDAFMTGKPENKLVLLWQIGMPALVSPTPSYRRAAEAAGIDMLCGSLDEWRDKLLALAGAPAETLREIGEKGRAHALEHYSPEEFRTRFDRAFESIGFLID